MAGELLTRTITTNSSGNAGPTIIGSVDLVGNEGVPFSQLVPASTTDGVYAWAFAHTPLQSIDINAATGTGATTTVKFYNASSLLLTVVLADGQNLHWDIDEYNANATVSPKWFGASDVTSIKVTTTDASTVNGNALLIV